MKPLFRKILAFLGVLLLSGIFFELGLWQLHRAQATQKISHAQPEQPVINLENVAAAGHNLRDASFNRLVTFRGHYIKFYTAPGQIPDGSTKPESYAVGLMELSGHRAILVVRGAENGKISRLADVVMVSGRLYPHENEDYALPSQGVLSRLDPALVAGDTSDNLFDGYVIAREEVDQSRGVQLPGDRIPSPQLIGTVGGFYWQHIAYIITWWFMAALVWFAPFYNRAVRRKSQGEESVE